MTTKIAVFLLILSSILFSIRTQKSIKENEPTTPTKIAFIGDQGLGQNAADVLNLIQQENVDLIIHSGDFDYLDDPQAWIDQIDQNTHDIPYLVSVGNHDLNEWDSYQQLILDRISDYPQINCLGDLGVNSTCTINNITIILSGVGTLGKNHIDYINKNISRNNSPWKICSWHKNQTSLQTGDKGNEVGYEAYESCRENGAFIVNGHEHAYSRTKTLSNTVNPTVNPNWTDPNNLLASPGNTVVFVSGLSGHSIRRQNRCLPTTYPYGCNQEWASIYTTSQDKDAEFGALFIEFHPNTATGYFKTTSGQIIDQFTIHSSDPS